MGVLMTAGGCGDSPWGDEGVLKLNMMMVIQPVNTL